MVRFFLAKINSFDKFRVGDYLQIQNVACASRSMHAHIGQHLHLLLGHNYMQLYIKMQYCSQFEC